MRTAFGLSLCFLVLCGCATKPAPAIVPAALMPPAARPRLQRQAVVTLGTIPATTPAPALDTLTMAWEYNGPEATFNFYGTQDVVTWVLLTNVVGTEVTVGRSAANQFYFVTATNAGGESTRPWVR